MTDSNETSSPEVEVFWPNQNAVDQDRDSPQLSASEEKQIVQQAWKQQELRRQQRENEPLKTQKIRDAEEKERMQKHHSTTIRVQFSDDRILEAKFASTEKVEALYNFIKSALETPDRSFLLILPPRDKLENMGLTLFKAGLAPSAKLIIRWQDTLPDREYLLSKKYRDMAGPRPTKESSTPSRATPEKSESSSAKAKNKERILKMFEKTILKRK